MEQPTLLNLNDDCLMEIFKFLELWDCISLASTCDRLRNVLISASQKIKEIIVHVPFNQCVSYPTKKAKAEVINMLSLVGDKILSFQMIGISPFTYEILDKVPNLKELKLDELFYTNIDKLTDYFAKNNQLVSLACRYEYGVFKCLKMLPNLTSLRILDLPGSFESNETVEDLFCLNGLTKFSFTSSKRCNLFLIELANRLELIELGIEAPLDRQTLEIMKLFRNLDRLSINNNDAPSSENFYTIFWGNITENFVLPPKLTCIKIGRIRTTEASIVSIVNNHSHLKELDICNAYVTEYGKLDAK